MIKNNSKKYGLVSKAIHLLIAGLMIFMIALGLYLENMDYYDPLYHRAINIHKSLGMVILLLFFIKLSWLFVSPMPKLDQNLKKWEKITASMVHKALWSLLILLPITGYIVSTSAGSPISIFGLFDIPATIEVSKPTKDLIMEAHEFVSFGAIALIILHIAAALKHRFIDI